MLCPLKDALLVKALKLTERIGNPSLARKLLAQLQHAPADKNWKIFLEGAALEARCGGIGYPLPSNSTNGGGSHHCERDSQPRGRDEDEAAAGGNADGSGNGNGSRDHVCRAVFAYLMRHASWFGPIYHDAAKFEERRERPAAALQVCATGFQ